MLCIAWKDWVPLLKVFKYHCTSNLYTDWLNQLINQSIPPQKKFKKNLIMLRAKPYAKQHILFSWPLHFPNSLTYIAFLSASSTGDIPLKRSHLLITAFIVQQSDLTSVHFLNHLQLQHKFIIYWSICYHSESNKSTIIVWLQTRSTIIIWDTATYQKTTILTHTHTHVCMHTQTQTHTTHTETKCMQRNKTSIHKNLVSLLQLQFWMRWTHYCIHILSFIFTVLHYTTWP